MQTRTTNRVVRKQGGSSSCNRQQSIGRWFSLFLLASLTCNSLYAQTVGAGNTGQDTIRSTLHLFKPVDFPDTVTVRVHPDYDRPGRIHRLLFGENYRQEWAAETRLPLIHISRLGLRPLQQGGGMQSKSLRLADQDGNEWVIRSVEKTPDSLLPPTLRGTFARDWLDDVTSAQHPFSALAVPPIAHAVSVAHAHPVIGVMAEDTALGAYNQLFRGLVVLLEEREPAGKSDNSAKMKEALASDNDHSLDGREMLRARMLDVLIGDWDRHEDQWRWVDRKKGRDRRYVAVPRDRDQVFHLTQGIIPRIASRPYILPTLRNFDEEISHSKWLLYKTRFVNAYPSFQLSREQWNAEAGSFVSAVTDSVFREALARMPGSARGAGEDKLLHKLQQRRSHLAFVMDRYYRYSHKVAEIQTSNKQELIRVTDSVDSRQKRGLRVEIRKLTAKGRAGELLMDQYYDPAITRELRLYTLRGDDSVVLDFDERSIRLRLIADSGSKHLNVLSTGRPVKIYDRPDAQYRGAARGVRRYSSARRGHGDYTPVNLDNVWMPLISLGLNRDDGLILGAGFRFIMQEGFRKQPYSSSHLLSASHSFSSEAYRVVYKGEWIRAIGRADVTLDLTARAPNNTMNFFGRGNNTSFIKRGDFVRYYRTRYSTYQAEPAIRFRSRRDGDLSIGPALFYYTFDPADNRGRYVSDPRRIGSYDSLLLSAEKLHVGGQVHYVLDRRSNPVIPRSGFMVDVRLRAYKGVNREARDFVQLMPEFSFYQKLNRSKTIILADRVGGTASVGKTAFYHSAVIGGQGNLLGYRQYRFAGQHSIYNNFELRIKLADIVSYILPGQFGIIGFWDTGRVWETTDNSAKWHHGTGAGIYFAPASMLAVNVTMGHSTEGWLPYFTLGLRF